MIFINRILRYLAILILLQIVVISGHAQIVIDGQIKNYDGKTKVYYTPTIEGILFTSHEITPGPKGTFRIQYNSDGIGTCRVSFKRISFSFVHGSKAKISFGVDQAKIKFPQKIDERRGNHVHDSVKQAATNFIAGDLADVNTYYNKAVRSSTRVFSVEGCDYSLLVKRAETPERVIQILDSLIQRELDQIDQLVLIPNIEGSNTLDLHHEMKKFLLNQVYSFYANVFLNGMMLKRHEQGSVLHQDPNAPLSIYDPSWERFVESYFINASKNIRPAASTFEYNELVLNMTYTLENYKKYDFDPPSKTDDEIVVERLLYPNLGILDSLSLLDDKGIFAYKLFNLSTFLQTQTFYSPVLLNAINELKLKYAASPHVAKFEPQIESLKKYLKSNSIQYDKAFVIETNYIRFEDLISTFKGKNILVDVWATWCGPCVEDFNYKSKLRPLIESGKISVLYVSIDKPTWEKKWKENMKFNQLEGYHVLANDILIEDMWKYLGGRQGVIPRYALIDRNGTLFLNEASRPSQGDELVNQIDDMVEK